MTLVSERVGTNSSVALGTCRYEDFQLVYIVHCTTNTKNIVASILFGMHFYLLQWEGLAVKQC